MNKPRIKLPESAKVGEIIDVKAVVTHPMETSITNKVARFFDSRPRLKNNSP